MGFTLCRSVLRGGSTAIFMFAYGIYFYYTELTKRFLLPNCSTFWSIMLANAAFSSWPSFPFLAYEHLFLLKSNWWLKYSWCDTVRISPCFGYLYGDYSSVHTSLYNFISVIRSIGMYITYLKIALNIFDDSVFWLFNNVKWAIS